MTNQIKPGDLVMVVKPTPCCGENKRIGFVFKVEGVNDLPGECAYCGDWTLSQQARTGIGNNTFLLSRLKKLNPPAEEESRETTKELEVV